MDNKQEAFYSSLPGCLTPQKLLCVSPWAYGERVLPIQGKTSLPVIQALPRMSSLACLALLISQVVSLSQSFFCLHNQVAEDIQ